MKLIETHAHLYSEQFKLDRPEALHRAVAAGVETILLPNIDRTSIDGMLELEAQFPATCHAMMGLHPCSVNADFEQELYLLEDWLSKRPFVAVGECGIDLYWDKTFLPQQQEALRVQLRLAKQYDLPIVLHTRSAFEEAYELVAEAQDGTLRGVFHCFSDGVAEAERIIGLGFKMGIGGVATFKNGGLDKVLPPLPGARALPRQAQRARLSAAGAAPLGLTAGPVARSCSRSDYPQCAGVISVGWVSMHQIISGLVKFATMFQVG
jgi:TatD DNase family protein